MYGKARKYDLTQVKGERIKEENGPHFRSYMRYARKEELSYQHKKPSTQGGPRLDHLNFRDISTKDRGKRKMCGGLGTRKELH